MTTAFSGETLLMKACQGRLAEFARVLVEDRGVDPNWVPFEAGHKRRLPAVLVAAKRGRTLSIPSCTCEAIKARP
jgi:hypothetical protein